ncbi:SDR family NAD(P)-dependent oxidoreductase [Pollutimonas sp. M17]|uniref:SDR family NAD(P)-dependent oxidoreductase n=1 Tax=Pollutimonas sp. M17 TaxID=2962065 RepID=UPI0021F4D241|nr:SDR family oxidoreductase [Pollutimonas sp. M17]UYO94815.1 SDR family oxidoreductase [Pollutimonas sp. M17]
MASPRLLNKIAIVIGGGSSNPDGGPSNGQAAAITFARQGATVIVADRVIEAAQQTVEEIEKEGGRAFARLADVTNADHLASLMSWTEDQFGRIDVLHNNVGIEAIGDVVDTTEEAWDLVHDVNLKGAFLACKFAVPIMRKQGGGSIINISSTASLRWSTGRFLAYNSSKAALNHMSRIMARQHAADKVRVNVVIPGMIDTPHIRTLYKDMSPDELRAKLAERDKTCPMGRQGSCWDVANAALFFASDESSYVTGALLPVDGGLSI